MAYIHPVTTRHFWRRGTPLVMGLAATALLTMGIADARVVGDCDIRPGAQCEGANLVSASLSDDTLTGANLRAANLTDAYIEGSRLARVNLTDATLDGLAVLRSSLAGANLSGATGANVSFSSTSLRRATARQASLDASQFLRVDGTDTDFTGAELGGGYIEGGTWLRADFTRADLAAKTLEEVDFTRGVFSGANLRDATVIDVVASRADLTDANLSSARISGTSLSGANLSLGLMVDTSLSYVDFRDAQVSGLVLQSATVRGAFFRGAAGDMRVTDSDLTGRLSGPGAAYAPNSLAGADLRGTNFTDSDLRGVDFTATDLRGADFTGASIATAVFNGADMRGATLPATSLNDRPRFRCDADTLWSSDYRRLFADYCAGKGSKVRPLWCKGDYEKTPGLCALCGRICIIGRAGDARTFDVPSRCESRASTMPRAGGQDH